MSTEGSNPEIDKRRVAVSEARAEIDELVDQGRTGTIRKQIDERLKQGEISDAIHKQLTERLPDTVADQRATLRKSIKAKSTVLAVLESDLETELVRSAEERREQTAAETTNKGTEGTRKAKTNAPPEGGASRRGTRTTPKINLLGKTPMPGVAKRFLGWLGDKATKAMPIVGAIVTLGAADRITGSTVAEAVGGEIGIGPLDLQTLGEGIAFTAHLTIEDPKSLLLLPYPPAYAAYSTGQYLAQE
jgi:hypothetical protein